MNGLMFVSSLLSRALVFLIPLCFWWLSASACYTKPLSEKPKHPVYRYLDRDEKKVLEEKDIKDKCAITKLGDKNLRFHVTDNQKYLNENEGFNLKKDGNNIVEVYPLSEKDLSKRNLSAQKRDALLETSMNFVLTPNCYGFVTEKNFPETLKVGIKHRFNFKEGGLPKEFLKELLAIDQKASAEKDVVVIISKGLQGYLGLSDALREELKAQYKKDTFKEYLIRTTDCAVALHNSHVKEGKKVFTFIHLGP